MTTIAPPILLSSAHRMTSRGVLCNGTDCDHVIIRAAFKTDLKGVALVQFVRCKWCKHENVVDFENLLLLA